MTVAAGFPRMVRKIVMGILEPKGGVVPSLEKILSLPMFQKVVLREDMYAFGPDTTHISVRMRMLINCALEGVSPERRTRRRRKRRQRRGSNSNSGSGDAEVDASATDSDDEFDVDDPTGVLASSRGRNAGSAAPSLTTSVKRTDRSRVRRQRPSTPGGGGGGGSGGSGGGSTTATGSTNTAPADGSGPAPSSAAVNTPVSGGATGGLMEDDSGVGGEPTTPAPAPASQGRNALLAAISGFDSSKLKASE